jgi:putative mRNA 3-end processing factor
MPGNAPLLRLDDCGLYCQAGGFHVDPWRRVDRAVITHAHSDHARWGSRHYLASDQSRRLLQLRLGSDIGIDTLPYGESIIINGVKLSFHPAGHILGSAQVRLEYRGEVWVVSGDYKTEPDTTCVPFEIVRCHTFITESTFGLPIYRWAPQEEVVDRINAWWRSNQERGKTSMLFGYALGKAQRLIAGLDRSIGPIYTHGAVENINRVYREEGISLHDTIHTSELPRGTDWSRSIIVAPPSANGTPWTRRFGSVSTAFASGWMKIRGARRRRAVDRGFVFSDHVDWPSLMEVVRGTGAERVLVTHGYVAVVVRWLREQGWQADGLRTEYEGERDDASEDAVSEDGAEPAREGEEEER